MNPSVVVGFVVLGKRRTTSLLIVVVKILLLSIVTLKCYMAWDICIHNEDFFMSRDLKKLKIYIFEGMIWGNTLRISTNPIFSYLHTISPLKILCGEEPYILKWPRVT